jgi:hypothetical protein
MCCGNVSQTPITLAGHSGQFGQQDIPKVDVLPIEAMSDQKGHSKLACSLTQNTSAIACESGNNGQPNPKSACEAAFLREGTATLMGYAPLQTHHSFLFG